MLSMMDNSTQSSNSSLSPILTTTVSNVPTSTEGPSHTMAYVLIPIGALLVVAVIAFIIMMIFKRNRMERLRHHLMPLYNFDPQEEDWESELLDDRSRRISYRDGGGPSPTSPKLKFNT